MSLPALLRAALAAAAASVALCVVAPASARAQSAPASPASLPPADDVGVEPDGATSSWSLTLLGGVLLPVTPMDDTHARGLLAGVRAGWTSRIGLGLDLGLDYSPLPRPVDDDVRVDSHYGTAMILPRYTLGRGWLRGSASAGGGLAIERAEMTIDGVDSTSTTMAPAVLGQLQVELHVITGGGVVLAAGATQAFGELDYRYAWGMGGLALAF